MLTLNKHAEYAALSAAKKNQSAAIALKRAGAVKDMCSVLSSNIQEAHLQLQFQPLRN
jgi:hypothetical protein